jgi:hypothetical protein
MRPAGADTLRRPQFSRSQIAQHNDDAHGYWFSIEQRVYNVTEFMSSHPGGDRILQLYAGWDATLGFQRVHQDRRHVTALLEHCRIGVLRSVACSMQAEHAAQPYRATSAAGEPVPRFVCFTETSRTTRYTRDRKQEAVLRPCMRLGLRAHRSGVVRHKEVCPSAVPSLHPYRSSADRERPKQSRPAQRD